MTAPHTSARPGDRASTEPAGEAAPILEIRDLNVSFGDAHVVRHVSMDVPAHSVTALIGPSGCGKTTFLRSLNRMHDLTPAARVEGSIAFHGENIYDRGIDPVDVRHRIGMVFQKPNPFPTMNIYDNVTAGLRLHGRKRKSELDDVVERSLHQAALWDEVKDRLRTPATGLSGGQQQRLCIARSLAVEPEILLMDEPTSALDPQATQRIEELLSDLKRFVTIVIVTHNMQQASRVSDETAFFLLDRSVMDTPGASSLIEKGLTETLFVVPRDPRTEAYITGRFG